MLKLYQIEGFLPAFPTFTHDEADIKSDDTVTEGFFITQKELDERGKLAPGDIRKLIMQRDALLDKEEKLEKTNLELLTRIERLHTHGGFQEGWDQALVQELPKREAFFKEEGMVLASKAWDRAKKNLFVLRKEHCNETHTVQSSSPETFEDWFSKL